MEGVAMLCAHTVRRLKPGTFDQFSQTLRLRGENAPAGWIRFHALRGLADENEVVTFGFLRRNARRTRAQPAGVRLPGRSEREAGCRFDYPNPEHR
jgi:hypothetical protein